MLQAFIALWSGAAVGPEGPLVFLTGGVGSFVSGRLKLQKDDIQGYESTVQSLEPSAVSLVRQSSELSVPLRYMFIKGARFPSPFDTRTSALLPLAIVFML